MTRDELNKVLENHKHWINEDCDGWESMRANLHSADLYGADLYGANLYGANLREADLREANLYGADLYGADLYGANLCDADLRDANLCGANLREADLSGANLRGVNLSDADLRDAKDAPYIPMACPDCGDFIGWKKDGTGRLIIKLLIPAEAKRSSATGRKCRCDRAKVLEIQNLDGTIAKQTETFSAYGKSFIYRVGTDVVSEFCEDRYQECVPGIHFFINRQEAVDY